MESAPKTLDWVRARSECSLEHVFMLLTEVVKSDVASIQARSPSEIQFAVATPTEKTVVVSKTENWGRAFVKQEGVVFERTTSGIVARTATQHEVFTAKPSLDINGECRLEIDDQRLTLWQVSRKALEPLFFSRDL